MLHPVLNACRLGLMALLLTGACSAYGQSGGTTRVARTLRSAGGRANAQPQTDKKTRGKANIMVYIGTYTSTKSKGIYVYQMNSATGELTACGVSPEVSNPSFLALHPNRRYLYAVNEDDTFNGAPGGAVTAFSIDPATGGLTLLNQQSSRGAGPCHLMVDHSGKNVLVANYGSGNIASLPISSDGKLGASTAFIQHEGSSVNKDRQEGPHAHSINLDPANRFALVADLGLDKIFAYRFDAAKGALTPSDPPFTTTMPGAGPRHLSFSPNGQFAYANNEMGNSVTAYSYDAHTGALKELQSLSTLPDGFTGENTTAAIQVHPSGKFLYVSNRGHDSITIFGIDASTGQLHLIGNVSTQGKTPRDFAIDPTGHFLLAANQNTDNVVVFRIDAQTGQLTPTGQSIDVPRPVCVVYVPHAH